MLSTNWKLLLAGVFSSLLISCGGGTEETSEVTDPLESSPKTTEKIFKRLSVAESGVDFVNQLIEDEKVNFFKYQYLYNGGGVALGDINNDGLDDLYLTGNNVPDKLYLNEGELKFKDITKQAGIGGFDGWKTGVTMVDINNDGFLDIYVCRSGWYEAEQRTNLLFINDRGQRFTEEAEKYGLADSGHSVQGAFFDYDNDGDLDMYLTNHPIHFKQKMSDMLKRRENPGDDIRDKFYRNDEGTFVEVAKEIGIYNYGHGLGLSVADLDQDGFQDVYVSNDFQAPDFYYHNNGDGTFTESLDDAFRHVSYFAMGNDVSDVDNDGHPDLFTVEMLAEDNKRQKTNMAPMNPELFSSLIDLGFKHQMMRNTFQINNGNGTFSEIGYYSGLERTDWSWGPVFVDFDLDGDKDLAITNGFLKDTQDKDFIKESNKLASKQEGTLTFDQVNSLLPSTRLPNYIFSNEGDFKFEKRSKEWGFDFSGYSNGIAYSDLDNDGDVDLVVNNINDVAMVYENSASQQKLGNYLIVDLDGPEGNRNGIGAKVTLKYGGQVQYQEFHPVHGFQSSCLQALHFGVGSKPDIDLVEVVWPDGRKEVRTNVPTNSRITFYHNTAGQEPPAPEESAEPFLKDITSDWAATFLHRENEFDDYKRELLLPHKESQHGPKVISGDVDGDGREDMYLCGAMGQAGVLYKQVADAVFQMAGGNAFLGEVASEDVGGAFFDADQDGDQDLYVVSGSNEYLQGAAELEDRLYINDGQGNFSRDKTMLPSIRESGGCVAPCDYDGDGDVDLFVGTRQVPGKYPFHTKSYLLENDNGKFVDVTATKGKPLADAGMVSTAVWTDLDGDKQQELILAGEWTPIRYYDVEGGRLVEKTESAGFDKRTGWWNKVVATDIDGDGDTDLVAGNLGLNYKYRASDKEPFQVYCHDFDENGTLDIVLGYYNSGECFPVRGRQCSSEQMPNIAQKFPTYEAFGEAQIKDVYGSSLDEAFKLEATDFASYVIRNEGDGSFAWMPLPTRAQFAPIQGIVAEDFTGDGNVDLLIGGNWYVAEVETGRADAGIGYLLEGNGSGQFKAISPSESGFFAWGDVRDLALVEVGEGRPPVVVVGNNNAPAQIFQVIKREKLISQR